MMVYIWEVLGCRQCAVSEIRYELCKAWRYIRQRKSREKRSRIVIKKAFHWSQVPSVEVRFYQANW